VGILRLPRASNIKEFDPLLADGRFEVNFIEMGEELDDPDLFIIPGTRHTISDFQEIKGLGYPAGIKKLTKLGSRILGIGGGFGMLGVKIIDIKGSEMGFSRCEGIGLFDIVTRIMPSEVVSDVEFEPLENTLSRSGATGLDGLCGFENHRGRTRYLKGSAPLFRITKRGSEEIDVHDGAFGSGGKVLGTYIHGLFGNNGVRDFFARGTLKDE
jgi:adenosylcobyric acid synthase